MRCSAYCIARSINLTRIKKSLGASKKNYDFYGDVVHFQEEDSDIFCFSYGCWVFWNTTEDQEKALLKKFEGAAVEPLAEPEDDEFFYEYGSKNRVFQDRIILDNESDVLSKLAISYGLAQSVKLSVYEERLEKTIQSTEHIPRALAIKGKIPLSRRDIGRKIGELFLERNSINLSGLFMDSPEFFWEYPKYEPLYEMAVQDLDIPKRSDLINKKLDIIHDLFNILGGELNHLHGSKLEWIIIILLVIEVIMTLINQFTGVGHV